MPRQTDGGVRTPADQGPIARPTAAAALAHAHPPVRSLYIHVPFCFHKCHYCDFYSIVDNQDRQEAFAARLIEELGALAPHAAGKPLRTVFVGGGTPSLLRTDLWRKLLGALDRLFDLTVIRDRPGDRRGEFTVECNPETVSTELMGILSAGGVNRVSIGAQSFDPQHLKTLERWHDPGNVERAVEMARAAGIERQSVDLIYAIPGQARAQWEADLTRAIALDTSHLSCYSLTYEPGTAMTARLNAGQFTRADEELETDMFLATVARLRAAGLERYEVSNFARPGDESRHNLAYWRQEQWLAAGPSAAGHVWAGADPAGGGYRWKNVPRLGDYLDSGGFAPVVELETPDRARSIRERIMMGLRLSEGIDGAAVLRDAEAAATGSAERLLSEAEGLRDRGHLLLDGGRWTLTDDGFLMADGAAAALMAAV